MNREALPSPEQPADWTNPKTWQTTFALNKPPVLEEVAERIGGENHLGGAGEWLKFLQTKVMENDGKDSLWLQEYRLVLKAFLLNIKDARDYTKGEIVFFEFYRKKYAAKLDRNIETPDDTGKIAYAHAITEGLLSTLPREAILFLDAYYRIESIIEAQAICDEFQRYLANPKEFTPTPTTDTALATAPIVSLEPTPVTTVEATREKLGCWWGQLMKKLGYKLS